MNAQHKEDADTPHGGGLNSGQCSKGWGARCARSKGKRCRCACGGRNHGGLGLQLSITDEGALELTPRSQLEYEWDEEIQRPELSLEDERVIRFERVGGEGRNRGTARILVCDSHGVHELRQALVYHSPTGLEFGYGGSGPGDTALNILRAAGLPPKECYRLHMDFKWAFVASADEHSELPMRRVKEWIRDRYAKEIAAGVEHRFEEAVLDA